MDHRLILICLVAVVAAFQSWVTYRLFRSSLYEPRQKVFQLVLIWLVPVAGAVVVYSIMAAEGKSAYKPEKGYTEPVDHGYWPDGPKD